ncbi:MAG: choice-of-anchor B family protein [Gemmatimonadales bacterium]
MSATLASLLLAAALPAGAEEPMGSICSSALPLLCSSPSATGFASAIALHGDELFVARSGGNEPRPAADGARIFVYGRSGDRWVSRGEIDPGGSVLVYERRRGAWALAATLASLQRTGYTHDAQCVTYQGPDARYHGREICFNASETAVGIADVTDKAAPKSIAVAAYPNPSYAHQGWLTEDQRYVFLDDEGDELAGAVPRTRTLVWDVSRLDEPVLLTECLGTTAATDHNL